MVTTNARTDHPFTNRFTVDIAYGNTGSIYIRIEREDGAERAYHILKNKLQIFTAKNGPFRDAVEFLLGDASV